MNMHAPQSVESVCELMNIAGVIHQIVLQDQINQSLLLFKILYWAYTN